MQPLIVLPGALRVALVIAAVAVAVLIIHLLTGSQRFEKRPGALTIICLVILCLGFAALFALSHGSPDPREIEGFEPFEASDTGSAAALVSDALGMEYSDGESAGRAEVCAMELRYEGGKFVSLTLTARFTGLNPVENGETAVWMRDISVDAAGSVSRGERAADNGAAGVDSEELVSALEGLGIASGTQSVTLKESGGEFTLEISPAAAPAEG